MNMSADTPARMRLATLCASAALAAPLAVQADALIDPDGTGATRVFPSQATTTTGDLAGERLVIGFSDGEGTLEVNAEAEVNGVTSLVNVGDLEIAQRDNERGELRVVGNGSAGSASVYQSGDFRLGANSDSFLSILDGGQFFSNNSAADNGAFGLLIGSYADFEPGNGNASVRVDGAGSRLEVHGGGIDVGFTNDAGSDSLTVSNGAVVIARQAADALDVYNASDDSFALIDAQVIVGADFVQGPTDTVTVSGAGSRLEFSSAYFHGGGNARTEVLDGGQLVQVENGDLIDRFIAHGNNSDFFDDGDFGISVGTVYDEGALVVRGTDGAGTASTVSATRDINIGGGERFAGFDADNNPIFRANAGEALVEDGALLHTTRDINVSEKDGPGTGVLTVNSGATVMAQTVNVFDGGLLNGNGGTVMANVLVDGGTIGPGNSPGSLRIEGNLQILDGLLQIEIGGTDLALYDQLLVTGDLIAPGGLGLELVFIDGFTPAEGDTFAFLEVLGDAPVLADLSLIDLTVLGLDPGAEFTLDFTGGGLSVTTTMAPAPVPLPAALPLFGSALLALGALRRRRRAA